MEEIANKSKHPWIRNTLAYVGELLRVVVISLAIILPIRYFLVQPFYVKGASMEPSFYQSEYLVIDELSYRAREPIRGEVVVFRYPLDPSQFFIKRIIGLPGETIQIEHKGVKVKDENGEWYALEEEYLDADAYSSATKIVALGEDEYYVLGDNRKSSLDSRSFGTIAKKMIIGRVWLRGWPFDKIAHIKVPIYEVDNNE